MCAGTAGAAGAAGAGQLGQLHVRGPGFPTAENIRVHPREIICFYNKKVNDINALMSLRGQRLISQQ